MLESITISNHHANDIKIAHSHESVQPPIVPALVVSLVNQNHHTTFIFFPSKFKREKWPGSPVGPGLLCQHTFEHN